MCRVSGYPHPHPTLCAPCGEMRCCGRCSARCSFLACPSVTCLLVVAGGCHHRPAHPVTPRCPMTGTFPQLLKSHQLCEVLIKSLVNYVNLSEKRKNSLSFECKHPRLALRQISNVNIMKKNQISVNEFGNPGASCLFVCHVIRSGCSEWLPWLGKQHVKHLSFFFFHLSNVSATVYLSTRSPKL